MDIRTFTDEFGVLLDVPESVPRLREMILQLAVQGRLVEQDPNDEPASILLERIRVERERLINEGMIRQSEPVLPAENGHHSDRLPVGWVWATVDQVGITNPRNDAPDDAPAGFVPMALLDDGYRSGLKWEVRPWSEIRSGFTHFRNGDVLMAKITPCFQNRKSAVVKGMPVDIAAGTTELYVSRPVSGQLSVAEYLLCFLKTPSFIEGGVTQMTGTAGQQRVPKAYFAGSIVPLPPLAEQKRIVAKVDQLMALCDELEQRQEKSDSLQVSLCASSLNSLTESQNQKEVRVNFKRVKDNFDLLLRKPKNVESLRQAILQLAVQGRLVEQDPNDEPASALLERIAAEKATLIAEGKIKKQKELSPIGDDEKPFALPVGWEWVRMNDIFQFIDYRGRTPKKTETGTRLVTAKNVRMGKLNREPEEFIADSDYAAWMTRGFPEVGDLLITTEAPLGKVCTYELTERTAFAQRVIILQPYFRFPTKASMYFMMSRTFQDSLVEKQTGMTALGIKAARLKLLPLPIAPDAEQKRIVAKVDQLMSLCDEVESRLRKSPASSRRSSMMIFSGKCWGICW